MSRRDHEWLGDGIYFWENAPGRAWQWAEEKHPGREAVVAAEIRLGRCLDLADTVFAKDLRRTHAMLVRLFAATNLGPLPDNTGGPDRKARRLDSLVINCYMRIIDRQIRTGGRMGFFYQTIRSPFEEGEPAFPGAGLRMQSHVQIVVRDRSCIVPRFFRIPREVPNDEA